MKAYEVSIIMKSFCNKKQIVPMQQLGEQVSKLISLS